MLDETEVLYYPGQYILHHHQVSISGWMWAHQNMLYNHLWDNVVPKQMKKLPIPLTGHCVVDISPSLILILGGSTVARDWYGRKIPSSAPVPTSHVHLYDFNDQSWLSTSLLGQETNLTRNQIPRVNHACAKYLEDGQTKVICPTIIGWSTKTCLVAKKDVQSWTLKDSNARILVNTLTEIGS